MLQEVTTAPGERYLLNFAYSPRWASQINPSPASTNGIELWIDGLLIDTFSGDGVPGLNSWQVRSYQALGDGSTAIEFRATGTSDSIGGLLDDVRLTTVLEPGTLALLGLGLAGLSAARRRR